jgi:tetratricopeptide (TPR) repeat protein
MTSVKKKDVMEIKKLNLLAFAKSDHPVCELTGKNATVQLITPQASFYYATEEVALQSWEGIVKKIAHLLGPLLAPPPIVGTAEERTRRTATVTASKRSLIEFCLAESSKLISVQQYNLAIPAAIQALKFCKDIDGDRSINMVEPYLQLGQIYLCLRQLPKAEEFLGLARWIVLNTIDCPDHTASHLHMLLGRVITAQGNFDLAKPEFAKSIFHASRCVGAESVAASLGYFRLGDVFLAQGNIESALAFFDKVVDIWYKYLSAVHHSIDPTFKSTMTGSQV